MTDQFRDAMDLLDNYDRSVTEVAHSLNEAMLELAHLKFTDPYTSVSTAGFRPTPAVRGVEEQEGRLVATWHKPEFNNPSFEEEDELQEQQIQRQLQLEFEADGQVDLERRFGNISQTALVSTTRKKFERVLQAALECATLARAINQRTK